MIGDTVKIVVDRPLGSFHPEYKDMYYPINYGYIEGIMAPDGEEKWVVAPEGVTFTKEEIMEQVRFQEQYYQSEIRM